MLLESEPVLDSAQGPNALVMRRSASSNLRGGSTFLGCFPWICEYFAYLGGAPWAVGRCARLPIVVVISGRSSLGVVVPRRND